MTISFTSQRSNILALTLKENSIKFVNLFDSSFICEISGISLNKNLQKNLDSSSKIKNKSSITLTHACFSFFSVR